MIPNDTLLYGKLGYLSNQDTYGWSQGVHIYITCAGSTVYHYNYLSKYLMVNVYFCFKSFTQFEEV